MKYKEYEDILKTYRGLKNLLDTAEEKCCTEDFVEAFVEGYVEGFVEGRAEGEQLKAINVARKMKSKGFSVADISEMTGLPEKEIDSL